MKIAKGLGDFPILFGVIAIPQREIAYCDRLYA